MGVAILVHIFKGMFKRKVSDRVEEAVEVEVLETTVELPETNEGKPASFFVVASNSTTDTRRNSVSSPTRSDSSSIVNSETFIKPGEASETNSKKSVEM